MIRGGDTENGKAGNRSWKQEAGAGTKGRHVEAGNGEAGSRSRKQEQEPRGDTWKRETGKQEQELEAGNGKAGNGKAGNGKAGTKRRNGETGSGKAEKRETGKRWVYWVEALLFKGVKKRWVGS